MKVALTLTLLAGIVAQDEVPIKFEAPKEWEKQKPSSTMRKAQYRIPDKEKKAKDAELTLFYFGNQGAMIDANIKRWAGQMGVAEPKPEKIEGKLKITLVDLSGTYKERPDAEAVPNARMLAAVVETDQGPWFFKLVGPADTVGDWREDYVKMLKGASL